MPFNPLLLNYKYSKIKTNPPLIKTVSDMFFRTNVKMLYNLFGEVGCPESVNKILWTSNDFVQK